MAPIELTIISILRTLVEVAGMSLLAQGALFVLAGGGREKNAIYRLFRVVTRPAIRLVRRIAPRVVVDRHIPFVAFFLLFWLWIFLAYARRAICVANALSCV
ncbi:MAG: hypothetical protein BGO63_04015 [Candidatus Accumulibacter sp. 66-26]|nr:hypothetical protein [Accumulibacter sp.]OJW48308.1 MAG: hypothetical protein BGO63_04015 [Candidatus Accumulibacter sp. 66-26]